VTPETVLWLLSGVMALAAGLALLYLDRRGGRPLRPSMAGLAPLAVLAAGLAVRAWQLRGELGAAPAEALLYVAAGAFVLLIWPNMVDRQSAPLILLGAGVAIFAAVVIDHLWPPATPLPQARHWVFALRNVALALGLGGWLGSAASEALRLPRAPSRLPGAPASGAAPLRLAFPALTLALLLGALWNLSVFGMAWRGLPAELWLAATWLVCAAYFSAGAMPVSQARWLAPLLTLAGLATSIMVALQTASLFW
jgi:hypothetical protein